jgi:hypothetical protein
MGSSPTPHPFVSSGATRTTGGDTSQSTGNAEMRENRRTVTLGRDPLFAGEKATEI